MNTFLINLFFLCSFKTTGHPFFSLGVSSRFDLMPCFVFFFSYGFPYSGMSVPNRMSDTGLLSLVARM